MQLANAVESFAPQGLAEKSEVRRTVVGVLEDHLVGLRAAQPGFVERGQNRRVAHTQPAVAQWNPDQVLRRNCVQPAEEPPECCQSALATSCATDVRQAAQFREDLPHGALRSAGRSGSHFRHNQAKITGSCVVFANLVGLDPVRIGDRLFDGSFAKPELHRLVQWSNAALKQIRDFGDRIGVDLA